DYAMVATALLTGLRCEELCRLRLEHVSVEAGFLRVLGKGRKVREVPLVPRLAALPPRDPPGAGAHGGLALRLSGPSPRAPLQARRAARAGGAAHHARVLPRGPGGVLRDR